MPIPSRLFAALLAGALGCNSVPAEQSECDSAVSRLLDCCPAFDAGPVSCIYDADSFQDPNITLPALSEGESECIRNESCATLTTTGVCARAQAARSEYYMSEPSPGYENPGPQTGVCP